MGGDALAPTSIEVLGGVRAWRRGRELPLGPAQQRSVLALLALAGGEPVPIGEIVGALWHGAPPRSAANVVHTYVRRLRQVLEPHRPARTRSLLLPTIDAGYALISGVESVDLWWFRQLARQARQARGSLPPDQLIGLLRRALELWKGPPGGHLPAMSHHHWARVMLEEHAALVDWFAQLALATGVAADALPVVVQAAADRPFDESLHARLIRLCVAVGRRSDAVQVYRSSQARLREELGLDPGPELTEAYRELLGQPVRG